MAKIWWALAALVAERVVLVSLIAE